MNVQKSMSALHDAIQVRKMKCSTVKKFKKKLL